MAFLLFLLAAGIFIFFIRNTTSAPEPEKVEDLVKQGYSAKEAKKEARAQRQEQRAQVRTVKDAAQTARTTAKFVGKLLK
jgi:hypothetical protein